MPKTKLHQQVLSALLAVRAAFEEVREEKGPTWGDGICECVHNLTYNPNADRFLRDHMALWPNASRDRNFPVPSMRRGMSPAVAFILARREGRLWDQSTAYGRVRVELLDWLIQDLS